MSTSQGEGHGVSEGQPPILHVYISPSATRSSEAGQSHRLSSPIVPIFSSPSLRLYLTPSFARSAGTRLRNSPTVRASPANAHTSVDISTGAHTSVDASGPPSRYRKRKLTSDIWNDFKAIYDDAGRLTQGQNMRKLVKDDFIIRKHRKIHSSSGASKGFVVS